ncbi:MAG: glycosyltransferase [Chloroflexota bacterium]|nr:glycosyltransferase [Gemmatimonadota bacterium]MDQ3225878.1 glycosyltransferase [Chloroflexota bacterium]
MITLCVREIPKEAHRLEGVAECLRATGYDVGRTCDEPWQWDADEVVWIQDNPSWFPRIIEKLRSTPASRRPFTVVWLTEPLSEPAASGLARPRLSMREIAKIVMRDVRATDVYTNYFCLRRLAGAGIPDLLVVSTPSRKEFLADRGIASHWVPLGYSPAMGRDMNIARDIDVLFLGSPDDPRHRRSVKFLRRRGVTVQVMGSWSGRASWGEPRTELINRTKIFLNLHRHAGMLSGTRLILGMANKALVVSEPIYDSRPFISGEHFVTAALEDMPRVIDSYLASQSERERIARSGFRFVTEHLKVESSIARIADLISANRQ